MAAREKMMQLPKTNGTFDSTIKVAIKIQVLSNKRYAAIYETM
jgi:hypothetical protein